MAPTTHPTISSLSRVYLPWWHPCMPQVLGLSCHHLRPFSRRLAVRMAIVDFCFEWNNKGTQMKKVYKRCNTARPSCQSKGLSGSCCGLPQHSFAFPQPLRSKLGQQGNAGGSVELLFNQVMLKLVEWAQNPEHVFIAREPKTNPCLDASVLLRLGSHDFSA